MKKLIKRFVPPIVFDFLKPTKKYGFFGNYGSWQEALRDSKGYDAPQILEKVKTSLLKVKSGQATYERDSVIFDKKQYSWPVTTSLLWVASLNTSHLHVIDFGGSLGSSYFQNIEFLKHLTFLRWNIVEQKSFVECGKKYFEDDHLKFAFSVEECADEKPNVFFASSTIQYLEDPYKFLEKVVSFNIPYILFDRTPFLPEKDRLTVQKVSPRIYDASYPAWFLNKEKFLNLFKNKYKLVTEFDSLAGKINLGDTEAEDKGFLFKRNDL